MHNETTDEHTSCDHPIPAGKAAQARGSRQPWPRLCQPESVNATEQQCIIFTDLVSDEVGFGRSEEHHLHERAPRLLDLNFQLQ